MDYAIVAAIAVAFAALGASIGNGGLVCSTIEQLLLNQRIGSGNKDDQF